MAYRPASVNGQGTAPEDMARALAELERVIRVAPDGPAAYGHWQWQVAEGR